MSGTSKRVSALATIVDVGALGHLDPLVGKALDFEMRSPRPEDIGEQQIALDPDAEGVRRQASANAATEDDRQPPRQERANAAARAGTPRPAAPRATCRSASPCVWASICGLKPAA